MDTAFWKKCRQVALFLPFTAILPVLPRPGFFSDPRLWVVTGAGAVFHLLAPYTSSKDFLYPSPQDRGSTWFLLLGCLGVYYVSLVQAAFFLEPPLDWRFGCGCALAVGALLFRSWTTSILGKLFTATITLQENHDIISAGPYRYLRHPAYLSSLATMLAVPLVFQSSWGLIAFAVVALPAYLYRIHVEEIALVGRFGAAYVENARRTWRLIPFVY